MLRLTKAKSWLKLERWSEEQTRKLGYPPEWVKFTLKVVDRRLEAEVREHAAMVKRALKKGNYGTAI